MSSSSALNLTESQVWSLVAAQVAAGIPASESECTVCCEVFTKQRRKPIQCNACDYIACNACYRQFLTSDGVSRPKCMNPECNTEWTMGFLKDTFTDSFISGELRDHATKILFQQQIAMLAATQPAVERRIESERLRKELVVLDQQIRDLITRKRVMQDDIQFLDRGGLAGSDAMNGLGVGAFQHKCCDPECLGFVSSAWKCGVCEKFSCTHCHEVKGATTEEVDAHVCDPGNIETVKLLKSDTKPCPGCGTYIFKTEGCDQMFCICCKKLWSWNTGRIEERGHNPHYLEWMRSRNGGDLVRDPADVQCGREIDWRFNGSIHASLRSLNQRCGKNANTPIEIEKYRSIISKWCESIIHVRHHDIPLFRGETETDRTLEQLRISYMLKRTSEPHFRLRVFQVHRNAEVSRQILELMIAMQNAATDILYRIHDTVTDASNSDVTVILTRIETQLLEMTELRRYAIRCLADIYQASSKTAKYAFTRDFSFALSN
jgi:hypothetical protein